MLLPHRDYIFKNQNRKILYVTRKDRKIIFIDVIISKFALIVSVY